MQMKQKEPSPCCIPFLTPSFTHNAYYQYMKKYQVHFNFDRNSVKEGHWMTLYQNDKRKDWQYVLGSNMSTK